MIHASVLARHSGAGVLLSCALGLALPLALAPAPAAAQNFPEKPLLFIVPSSAGTTTDILARVIGESMSKTLRETIIVEDKPGADQIIGLEFVAKGAPADGHTVGIVGIDGQALLPLTKKGLRFDPINDLAMVAGLGEVRYALAGPSTAPYKNFKELIDAVKASPGKFNYGSSAPQVRFPSLVLMQELGLDMVYVPFAGGGPYLTAVAAGTVDWGIVGEGTGGALKPRVRFYAVTGRARSPANPDTPTFAELGFLRVYGPAYAMLVRAGTAPAIIDKLSGAAAIAMASPEVKNGVQKLLFEINFDKADVATKGFQERFRFYQEFAKKIDMKPE